ncbi:tetratricopeptide repeat protein [Aerosakkonemataceae cyanobacterium BLCC-F50]|uniref:Tetratricopeptide repeat protein n=1 Tax=Floridaenema flaviceps BLCC-F50 TaxID=3153642 RepID=A0ABV4XZ11_9CYAN
MSRLSVFAASLMFAVASTLPLGETTPTILSASAQTTTNQQRKAEAYRLFQQAQEQSRQSQFQEALRSLEQALVIYRTVGDKAWEGVVLAAIGLVYNNLGQYPKALEFYQQALAIVREVGNKAGEGTTLDFIGAVYVRLGQYPKALEFYQQALAIHKEVGNKAMEGKTLNNLVEVYISLGQYRKALEKLSQALAIFKEVGDKAKEGAILNNTGTVYVNLGEYPKALKLYQQALAINREVGDKAGEGTTLAGIGSVYRNLGQYPKALELYHQALAIVSEVGDKAKEGTILNGIGAVYSSLGQYPKALETYQQALAIFKEIGNKAGEGMTLNNIGEVYIHLGQYPKTLENLSQALAIFTEIGGKAGEGTILNGIGLLYSNLGQYSKALEFHQQALAINREVGNRVMEGITLNNLGTIYENLGQYPKALEFFSQALAIFKEIGDKAMEGTTLNNLGAIYENFGQYPKALEFYQQSLAIHREIGNKAGQGTTLNNLGGVYRSLGQYPKTLENLSQALAIFKEIGDKAIEGTTLNNLGAIYENFGQYPKALEFYQQALAISREVGNKAVEGTTLNNIGFLLNKQNQPELAIVFYKQSVNVTETIRQDLRKLPQEQQKSYTGKVAFTYRGLANLLLGQGRILEAQQVLELLKIQEIRDYTRNAKASNQTSGIDLNSTEEQISKTHGSLIAFGQKVTQCRQTQCSELSQLNDQLQALTTQYNQSIATLKQIIANRRAQDQQVLDPNDFGRKAREIIAAQPGTVLIYPFVVEDKTWLLFAGEGGVLKSVEVPVSRRQLGETVLKFRQLLQQPNSNIEELKATSKQLYDWLIKPLESEIKGNKKVTNLVFSLDRVTRYIPMAALFDGEKYLIENYTVSTILSAGLTDVSNRLPPGTANTPVLGLGLSNAVAGFNPLPNVLTEVDMVVRENDADKNGIYPGLAFLNNAFNWQILRDRLSGKKILHIATHGEFVAGKPEDSYLLLGTGEKLAIPQIKDLVSFGLTDVHLVVLSACETALGGADAEGLEISGISAYFLEGGAKAAIASLWLVNDASTSLLMQTFYNQLANNTADSRITKAEALRNAQLSFLRGNNQTGTSEESRATVVFEIKPGTRANFGSRFSHPYYWAPFVLIGNGL